MGKDVAKKVNIIQNKKVATATLCCRLDVLENAIALIQKPSIMKTKIVGLSSLTGLLSSLPSNQGLQYMFTGKLKPSRWHNSAPQIWLRLKWNAHWDEADLSIGLPFLRCSHPTTHKRNGRPSGPLPQPESRAYYMQWTKLSPPGLGQQRYQRPR